MTGEMQGEMQGGAAGGSCRGRTDDLEQTAVAEAVGTREHHGHVEDLWCSQHGGEREKRFKPSAGGVKVRVAARASRQIEQV